MRRLLLAAVFLAALHAPAPAQQAPHTPTAGSEERRAILDALRPAVERGAGVPVVFADVRLAVLDGWAYVRTIPYAHPSAHADTLSDLRLPCDCDPFAHGLLRGGGGTWRVVDSAFGVPHGSSPQAAWAARHRAPAALFRRDPDDAALEAAMREFITAFATRAPERLVRLLPRTEKLVIVNRISTPSDTILVSTAELDAQFRKREGWYWIFFEGGEMDDYAEGFREKQGKTMWRRDAGTLYAQPWGGLDPAGWGRTVRWKKEDGRWVVEELGVMWS